MNFTPLKHTQEYKLIIKDLFTSTFLVDSLSAIKRIVTSPFRYNHDDSSMLVLWALLIQIISTNPLASAIQSNATAHQAQLHPMFCSIHRNLSLYLKEDGTRYECVVDSTAPFKFIILGFKNLADKLDTDFQFKDRLSSEFGFSEPEVLKITACTTSALRRLAKCETPDELVTDILTLLMQFNRIRLLSSESVQMESFNRSFSIVGATEKIRAIGARGY